MLGAGTGDTCCDLAALFLREEDMMLNWIIAGISATYRVVRGDGQI